jgi:hypothetical protein
MARIQFTVRLNGTDTNPFLQFGLSQNPFTQLSDAKYDAALRQLGKLGAEPIPDTDHIRRHLVGFSEEFVNLCCARFQKGKMIEFEVYFDE